MMTNDTCMEAYTTMSISGQIVQYFRPEVMSCFGHLDGSMDACQEKFKKRFSFLGKMKKAFEFFRREILGDH